VLRERVTLLLEAFPPAEGGVLNNNFLERGGADHARKAASAIAKESGKSISMSFVVSAGKTSLETALIEP
jgi:hypothetical protein